jgi:hypothetical protein
MGCRFSRKSLEEFEGKRMTDKLIGKEFFAKHPAIDKNEMRKLRITERNFWGNDAVVVCDVIEGEGTWCMVYLSELPDELKVYA